MMRDCPDCQGTGIGWPPPDASCISCRGRGYHDDHAYDEWEAEDRRWEQWRDERAEEARWGGDAA